MSPPGGLELGITLSRTARSPWDVGSVVAVIARHPYLERTGLAAMAHRGGALEAAENTRAGFEHAVRAGYLYIETDVQVTRDGVAVLFHDDHLDRTTDAKGSVSSLTWAELRRVGTHAGTDQIMRLDEALEGFPDQRFNLDLKSDRAVEPVLDVLVALRATPRVLVGSFSDERLRTVRRRLGPTLATSAGPREVARAVIASRGLGSANSPALALQVPVSMRGVPVVSARLIAQAHARRQEVHVWTVNDEPEMRRLLDLGVDGIVTDRPTLLRQVLEDRGQWHHPTRPT